MFGVFGVHQLPSYLLYVPAVASAMSQTRYQQVSKYMYVVSDSAAQAEHETCAKFGLS